MTALHPLGPPLAPVVDLALGADGLRGAEGERRISDVLAASGWILVSSPPAGAANDADRDGGEAGAPGLADTDGDAHWRATEAPAPELVGASVWVAVTAAGPSLGLIAEAASPAAAHALRDALASRVAAEPGHVQTDADGVWTSWSNGHHVVRLAVHARSSQSGAGTGPTVQLDVEPVPADEPSARGE